jgi:hypothetical protein
MNDGTFATGALNGQLRRTSGAFGMIHEVLAELIEADRTGSGDGTFNVGGFDFAARLERSRLRVGGLKPKRVGIQREQTRLLCGRVAKLETKLDGRDLRRRPGQQEIGIADGMKSTGTAESATDLIPADGFSDMVNDDHRRMRGIA